jgi:hypothetical protein
MTYFDDMGTATLVAAGPHIRAVGWLDSCHPFLRGDVPQPFEEKLRQFAEKWGASAQVLGLTLYLGGHPCELCGRALGTGHFGVPGEELLFVAPELVHHYVTGHRYLPPMEFMTAVMKSPLPDTADYVVLIQRFLPIGIPPEYEQEVRSRIQESDSWQRAHGYGPKWT